MTINPQDQEAQFILMTPNLGNDIRNAENNLRNEEKGWLDEISQRIKGALLWEKTKKALLTPQKRKPEKKRLEKKND